MKFSSQKAQSGKGKYLDFVLIYWSLKNRLKSALSRYFSELFAILIVSSILKHKKYSKKLLSLVKLKICNSWQKFDHINWENSIVFRNLAVNYEEKCFMEHI